MEKKNTILLTVIAVATLLVAVVGATFAYFTATVTTENDANNTTEVKTRTIASATMDYGSKVSGANVLPGYKVAKTVTVVGNGNAGDLNVNAVLTLTPNIPTEFGSHVKYTVYEADATKTADGIDVSGVPTATDVCPESTDATKTTDGGKYFDNIVCTTTGLTPVAGKSGSFSGSTPVTVDIEVAYNTAKVYYVVIEYENDENAQQNNEQGKTFTVAMKFAAKA